MTLSTLIRKGGLGRFAAATVATGATQNEMSTEAVARVAAVAVARPPRHASGSSQVFRGAVEIVTQQGKSLWLVTDEASVRLIPPGGIYFTGAEVSRLEKAGREAAQAALTVKQVFGNDAQVIEGQEPGSGN